MNIRAAVTDAKEAPFEIQDVTKLDPDVPLDIVAPFGCGIQTGAWAVPHYGFDDIERAAHEAESGEVVKPVLRMV